jgi:hypothetical protein
VRFDDPGDALAALARETLVQAGCEFADDAQIVVLGDAPLERLHGRAAPPPLTLALNHAALALLEHDGAQLQRLELPQFGRALPCQAIAGGLFDALGSFQVGIHTTHRVLELPPGWQLAASGADGRVVAALHPRRRCVALLFRPDSLASLHHGTGRAALRIALDWLVGATASPE